MNHCINRTTCLVIALIPLIIIGLSACGGKGSGPELAPAKSSFQVNFWPESLVDQASVASVVAVPIEADGSLEVELKASGVNGLKAVYVDLSYDAKRYTPVSVTLASEFIELGAVLELLKTEEPGKLYYGAVLANFNELEGVSGDLVLATVSFTLQPHVGGKPVSAVPSSPESAAQLSWDEDTKTFTWGYSSQGDYDQNGETNIADLSPLGKHFKKAGPFEHFTVESVVDGDDNGEINIADISPIGMNFQNFVDRYYLCASEQESDTNLYLTEPANVASLSQFTQTLTYANGDKATSRLRFVQQVSSPLQDHYYWVHVAEGNNIGTPSNTVLATLPVNQPPLASFVASALTGLAPLSVDFDASASSDPDGTVLEYAWDWDGEDNGVEFVDSSTSPLATHVYPAPGQKTPMLRVTDNKGATGNSAGEIITISPPNQPPTADLWVNPSNGDTPLTVTFDGSLSSDLEGAITKFEFDLDGDGTFELDNGTNPLAYYEYTVPGDVNVGLRVTDEVGATDTDSETITASTPIVQAVLEITDPPSKGLGSSDDPYIVGPGEVYHFTMTHPVDGDVTSLSTFDLTPDNGSWGVPGEWTAGVADPFKLRFYAEYDGVGCSSDDWIYILVSDAVEALTIRKTGGSWGASGSGTELDPYIIGGSYDPPLEYAFEANTMSDFSGDDIDVNTLSWHAIPEAMVNWVSPGLMTPNPTADGPVYANDGVDDSNMVYILYTESFAPSALLLSDGYIGTALFTPTLDASGSSDPEDDVLQYEFDLDDDCIFEIDNGTDPILIQGFSTPGLIDIAVRVSDPYGNEAFDYLMLVVEATPTLLQPDTIYVLPDRSTAEVGDIVTMTVFCYQTANPLKNLNSATLTWPAGNPISYTEFGIVNVGERGGFYSAVDGVWVQVGISSFWIVIGMINDSGDPLWLEVATLSMDDVETTNATGALFNFNVEINFDLDLTIVGNDGLERTKYSDASSTEYTWANDDNAGFPGVTVP